MSSLMEALPAELLLKIFEYLEYWDLKLRIPLVNRKWRALVSKSEESGAPRGIIHRILFRDHVGALRIVVSPTKRRGPGDFSMLNTPPPSPRSGKKYIAHPIFSIIHYNGTESLDAVKFRGGNRATELLSKLDIGDLIPGPSFKLSDTPAYNENAVSPATDVLILHIRDATSILREEIIMTIRESGFNEGVRVSDVMKSVILYRTEKLLEDCIRLLGDMAGVERYREAMEDKTRADRMMAPEWKGVHKLEILGGILHMFVQIGYHNG